MKFRLIFVVALIATVLRADAAQPDTPLILISLDGFRWDYCDLFPEEAATLRTLKREGVAARGLIPVFPSNTFPNHYSIVTGLYPSHHGIVNNDFFDPALGLFFHYNQPASVREPRWWGGEPIWVTAIKQGQKAATSFWVGSEAEVRGVRPTFWRSYDYSIPFEKRLDELTGWLKLPLEERPSLIAFYLEETNSAGHRYGPASPQVAAAIKLSDGRIAAILARLRAAGIEPNLIIASDHGMTATNAARTIILDDLIDLSKVRIDADGSAAALRPVDGDVDGLIDAFKNVPHVTAYRTEELPARFHFKGNNRIAPVWVLPEEGWHVVARAAFNKYRERYREAGYLPGDHGYDPALTTMRGTLIMHGPAFRRGIEIDEIENVHLYNLMCAMLNLKPAPNDGDDRLIKTTLRE